MVRGIADFVWKQPVWCRISREHVPDPGDLFRADVQCLRCGRHYDDGVAQVHRQVLLSSRASRRRDRRPTTAPAGRFKRSRAYSD